MITDWNSTTKVASVADFWRVDPASGSGYSLIAVGGSHVSTWSTGSDPIGLDVAAADGLPQVRDPNTTQIGTAGAGLSNIPWNASWDAEAQSEAADALVAYDPPTGAELVSEIDAVQTDVAAVEAQTDDIGVAGAGLTAIPSTDITKNAVLSDFEFVMVDSTDHISPKTGLTVTGQRSCDGASFTAVAGAIAEVGSGVYQFDALAADTNCNLATWRFSATGADTFLVTFRTRP